MGQFSLDHHTEGQRGRARKEVPGGKIRSVLACACRGCPSAALALCGDQGAWSRPQLSSHRRLSSHAQLHEAPPGLASSDAVTQCRCLSRPWARPCDSACQGFEQGKLPGPRHLHQGRRGGARSESPPSRQDRRGFLSKGSRCLSSPLPNPGHPGCRGESHRLYLLLPHAPLRPLAPSG